VSTEREFSVVDGCQFWRKNNEKKIMGYQGKSPTTRGAGTGGIPQNWALWWSLVDKTNQANL
jgi:hypothetical protein